MAEKLSPVERLMQYMDACARARGEASWIQGYRARYDASDGERRAYPGWNAGESQRLYDKERALFAYCTQAEFRFRRYATYLLRKARQGPNHKAAQRLRRTLRRRGAQEEA